jgi:plastocyanin
VLGAVVILAAVAIVKASAAESTHIVRLAGNRFSPVRITARAGDSLRFVNGSGLHNIAFREDSLSPEQRRLIDAMLPGRDEFRSLAVVPLASPILVSPDEEYAFRLAALPPGRYEFFCAPHVSAGMRGTLIIEP